MKASLDFVFLEQLVTLLHETISRNFLGICSISKIYQVHDKGCRVEPSTRERKGGECECECATYTRRGRLNDGIDGKVEDS